MLFLKRRRRSPRGPRMVGGGGHLSHTGYYLTWLLVADCFCRGGRWWENWQRLRRVGLECCRFGGCTEKRMVGVCFVAGLGGSVFGGNQAPATRGRRVTQMVTASPAASDVSTGKENTSDYVMNTYSRYDVTIAEGHGVYLKDTEGKEYLDFVSGIATCALGHANPVLNAAVMDQLNRFHHVSNLFYIPEQAELAKKLVEQSAADKVFFCNSGAEANEAAIKLMRKYASVKRGIEDGVILTANQSFHGRTLATITATGQTKYQKHFTPLLPGFSYVEYNSVSSIEEAFKEFGDKIIGVMLEACQGEGGVVPGDKEYFAAVRQLCDKNDALLMMDEVQCGVGRTGKMWGFENLDVVPDIFTLAKGLGAGVPIGAMLCTERVNVYQPGDHASTFGGNALSSAAALTVIQLVSAPGFIQNVSERGEQLRSSLQDIAAKYPEVVSDVRGWGLINGIELTEGCGFSSPDVIRLTTASGLLLVPAGPRVVRFLPPLIVTEAEMAKAIAIFSDVLDTLVAKSS